MLLPARRRSLMQTERLLISSDLILKIFAAVAKKETLAAAFFCAIVVTEKIGKNGEEK